MLGRGGFAREKLRGGVGTWSGLGNEPGRHGNPKQNKTKTKQKPVPVQPHKRLEQQTRPRHYDGKKEKGVFVLVLEVAGSIQLLLVVPRVGLRLWGDGQELRATA